MSADSNAGNKSKRRSASRIIPCGFSLPLPHVTEPYGNLLTPNAPTLGVHGQIGIRMHAG
ncbi:hypothetical protein EYF80_010189 [Liparis tanakae]|uniref:Uncharacterized protein n=1 Tax=Liparis tanakae TaxID=230148 RepID=A0A4Z2IP89_9TELE|nr:hypothetical protein EYF80_010189 [Liparis tanakae]